MKIRVTLIEELLGTASANKEVHEEFIAKKSADKERIKEELESLPAEELMEKTITVFPRDSDGSPILWDYQFKGFIKESVSQLVEFEAFSVGKKKLSKYTYKRFVDNFVFVSPRKIRLVMPEGTEMGLCTRPLRAETLRGPRIALATSETVPAGTTFECEIKCLHPAFAPMIADRLNYGELKGLGQWRNGGKGAFTWELIAQQRSLAQ